MRRGPRLTCLVALTALVAASGAEASQHWLEKKKPEELFAYIDTNDCPVTLEELTGIVQGLLIRSRIKPLTKWVSGDIALYVTVDCVGSGEESWVFDLNVMLARFEQSKSSDAVISFRHEDQFGSYGTGGKELISSRVTEATDKAIIKYLGANFDLEPGPP